MKKSILYIFLVCIYAISVNAQSDIRTVKAVRTHTPVIDGVFSADEWAKGGKADNFIQLDPAEGESATEDTEAYILFDENYLYVGVKAFESETDKINANFTARDNARTSDVIGISLDTFHDHINAYYFSLTAAGTKSDGKFYDDNRGSRDWDGIWWGEASITDYGWCAEFKIPFNTLQFAENSDTWGINIWRDISRKRERSYWQPQSRDDHFRVSKSGHLEGLQDLKKGANLQVIPYLTSSFQEDRTSNFRYENNNGVTGIDIKYGITSNLNAVVTLNPDFAQIEADDDQINLSRYPLYLREKRPFFLEGGVNFNTAGMGHSDRLFYSRRINEPVYGAKITGKVGEWNIGVLHSLNDNDMGIANRIDNEELAADFKRQAFYNVVRINRDILDNSQVGVIAMSKEYEGNYNRILGFDSRINFNGSYSLAIETGFSFTGGPNNGNHSIRSTFRRQADFFAFVAAYNEQGENFNGNELGFFNYNNFRYGRIFARVAPRIEKYWVRQVFIGLMAWGENFQTSNFFKKETMSRNWRLWTNILSMDYWALGGGITKGYRHDRIDETLYDNLRYDMFVDNNRNSDIYFRLSHNQGKYRSGYSWSYDATLLLKPFNSFNVELGYQRSLVRIADEETGVVKPEHYEIMRSKFYYYLNRDLNARLILQYNRYSDRLNAYFLVAYRFSPGCAFYLAYNEQWDSELYTDEYGMEVTPTFGSSNKILQLKFSYLFQF